MPTPLLNHTYSHQDLTLALRFRGISHVLHLPLSNYSLLRFSNVNFTISMCPLYAALTIAEL